jgi:hypothetical protein
MGYEIFMVSKEMILGVELYSYRKVYLDIKITRRVYNFYVLFDKASPYLLEDVYEVLILCYRRPISVDWAQSISILSKI